jgi:hypothetical protein
MRLVGTIPLRSPHVPAQAINRVKTRFVHPTGFDPAPLPDRPRPGHNPFAHPAGLVRDSFGSLSEQELPPTPEPSSQTGI